MWSPWQSQTRTPTNMAISFPNRSRSYDATRQAVHFWGYDRSMESSFFVTADLPSIGFNRTCAATRLSSCARSTAIASVSMRWPPKSMRAAAEDHTNSTRLTFDTAATRNRTRLSDGLAPGRPVCDESHSEKGTQMSKAKIHDEFKQDTKRDEVTKPKNMPANATPIDGFVTVGRCEVRARFESSEDAMAAGLKLSKAILSFRSRSTTQPRGLYTPVGDLPEQDA